MWTRRRGWAIAMVLAMLGTCVLLSPASGAEEGARDMEQLLPADTDIFLRWKNPKGTQAYENSALDGLLSEPEMQKFVDHADEELTRTLRSVADRTPVNIPMVRDVLGNSFCAAMSLPSPKGGGPPRPSLVLSTRFSVSAEKMEKRLLQTMRRVAPPDFHESSKAFEHGGHTVKKLGQRQRPVFYTFMEGRWIAATGRDLMTGILDRMSGDGDALAGNPKFSQVMEKTAGPDATVALYLDAKNLLSFSQPFMPPQARKLVGGLNLRSIKAVGVTSRFEGGGMRDSIYLLAPDRKAGLLPPTGATVDPDLLKLVPKNARTMSLSSTDLSTFYRGILSALKAGNPGMARWITNMRDRWEKKVGFDIEKDLLGSLGKQALFYSTAHGHAAAVAVDDRQKLNSCMSSLAETYSDKVRMQKLEYRGHTIRHLDITAIPFIMTPSYTYHEGMAVFGLWPQAVKKFIARVEEGEPSILQNEEFQRVCGNSLGEKALVQYSDTEDYLVSFYDMVVIGMQSLNGLPQTKIRPELFPSNRAMEPHVFDSGSTWTSGPEGLLMETYSPFGTAGNLMAGIGAMGQMYTENASTTMPVMAAMIVPAIYRARAAARRAASGAGGPAMAASQLDCLKNANKLANALAKWSNEHDGELPESLGKLYPSYIEEEDTLLCPLDSAPAKIKDDLRSSYRYIGHLPYFEGAFSSIVVAYEDVGSHSRGRSVVFLDWHAERIPEGQFNSVMKQSLEALKKGCWDELSEERKKELRRFHSPGSR